MRMKMKYRWHKYDINRHSPRHVHKYTKYKKCLTMMIVIFIKQHLTNNWMSIHEKVKQNWGWIEKRHCLLKKRVNEIKPKLKNLGNIPCTSTAYRHRIIETWWFKVLIFSLRIFSKYLFIYSKVLSRVILSCARGKK